MYYNQDEDLESLRQQLAESQQTAEALRGSGIEARAQAQEYGERARRAETLNQEQSADLAILRSDKQCCTLDQMETAHSLLQIAEAYLSDSYCCFAGSSSCSLRIAAFLKLMACLHCCTQQHSRGCWESLTCLTSMLNMAFDKHMLSCNTTIISLTGLRSAAFACHEK